MSQPSAPILSDAFDEMPADGNPADIEIPPATAVQVQRERATLAPSTSGRRIQRRFDKIEAFVSRLSMRDNFWNSICSLIWLPLAFFSGIRLKELTSESFAAQAILPFRRFNRNWYRAMAGWALLANSAIAGGA